MLDPALDTSDEWIRSHTGIGSRYVASRTETVSSMGTAAAGDALAASVCADGTSVRAEDVELIVCATSTPDYRGFPSAACLVQQKLKAARAAAFDVSAACSGFVYALDTACALMERHGYRFAIVIGSEVLSGILDWSDRSTCVLFGDGAGALVLENRDAENSGKRGVGRAVLGADGGGFKDLYVDPCGHIKMNGRAVYTFAVRVLGDVVSSLLARENMTLDDIDRIVCHQANERILRSAAKRLDCPLEKFVFNMEEYGNTSAASIPVTLADMERTGQLARGMTVLIAGFGAGLTWGGSIIRW